MAKKKKECSRVGESCRGGLGSSRAVVQIVSQSKEKGTHLARSHLADPIVIFLLLHGVISMCIGKRAFNIFRL